MTEYVYLNEMFDYISAELKSLNKKIQKNSPGHPINLSIDYDVNYGIERAAKAVRLIEKSYFYIRNNMSMALSMLQYPETIGYMKTEDESIEIDEENQTIQITLPHLLPLKTKVYAHYLPMKLHTLLLETKIEYSKQNKRLPFFEKAAVVFIHHINPNIKICDFDNLERKSIMDLLRTFFFYSDNMLSIISTDLSVISERNYTEICIFPMEKYKEFICFLDEEYSAIFK